ncbi:MAG: hypothetical protein HW374_1697, partial [Bacteroidetes bacterium]|nr:hypothetical protein [Bacteroidota bacterium]
GSAFVNEKKELEYNVKLDLVSYAAIFDVPSPVYWLPCWHVTEDGARGEH